MNKTARYVQEKGGFLLLARGIPGKLTAETTITNYEHHGLSGIAETEYCQSMVTAVAVTSPCRYQCTANSAKRKGCIGDHS